MAKGRNKIVDAGALNTDLAANLDTTREVALSEFDSTRAQYDGWKGSLTQDMFDKWTHAYETGAWFALPKSARLDADKPSANDMLKRFIGLPANTSSDDPRVVSIRNDSDHIRLRSKFAKAAGKKGRTPKVTAEKVQSYLDRNLGKVKISKVDIKVAEKMLDTMAAWVEKVKVAHTPAIAA